MTGAQERRKPGGRVGVTTPKGRVLEPTEPITVGLTADLIESIDKMVSAGGATSRSEAIRILMRKALGEQP